MVWWPCFLFLSLANDNFFFLCTIPQDGYPATAVKKIFLEYATVTDACNAERELKGRAFGPNVVGASYFSEEDYAGNRLS